MKRYIDVRVLAPFACVLIAAGLTACGDDGDGPAATPTATPAPLARVLLAPEGNRLRAYSTGETTSSQVLIPSHADDPENGRDINGQICFQPGTRRFISGEDTGQPNPPPAWGLFELSGDEIGDLSAAQIGRLVTTFQGEPGEEGVPDSADPYGCGFLSDGRLVTTDIGNTAAGPANGQLVIWFPPLDEPDPAFCKLDIEIGTAGGVWVDSEDRVYVASARVAPGVHRYTGPFPTSNDLSGGCGRTDPTGAPLADEDGVQKELFIATDEHIVIANGVSGSPSGRFYVSSIINGVIAEYDEQGEFTRRVLEPPPGEVLGPDPFSTGTPLGLAVDADGTVYYADLGLVIRETGIGPGPDTGTVRRIRFDGNGDPSPPETLGAGFRFPDGLGVYEPD